MIINKLRYKKNNFLKSYIKLIALLGVNNITKRFFFSKKSIHSKLLIPALASKSVTCLSCEKCVQLCPDVAITNKNGVLVLDLMRCSSCQYCKTVCPENLLILNEVDYTFVRQEERFRTL